jgi:rRNA processing protein Krr1/Pno1
VAELQRKVEDLEYHRSSSSLSLSEEKDIIRQIGAVKKQMTQYTDVKSLRDERKAVSEELDAAMQLRELLRDNMRTLQVLDRVRALNPDVAFEVTEVLSECIVIPSAVVGRIIGKQGATRKQLEQELRVLLDFEEKPKDEAAAAAATTASLKITGLPDGLARARLKIDEISGEEEETVAVDAGLLNLLLVRGGAGIRQLESDSGARAKILRERSQVKLIGSTRCIAEAKAWLAAVLDSRAVLNIPITLLPSIIGTGGAHFRRIQEAHAVEIDTSKVVDGQDHVVLTVWGVDPSAVDAARTELLLLVEANTKHVITIAIEPAMVPFLVADSAAVVREFQKAHNVFVNVRRLDGPGAGDDDAADGAAAGAGGDARRRRRNSMDEGEAPPGAAAWVRIRGVRDALVVAQEEFGKLRETFAQQYFALPISTAQAKAIIGKSGDKVKKLRADTGAAIEVDVGGERPSGDKGRRGRQPRAESSMLKAGEALVSIRSDNPEKLEAAKAAILALVDGFVQRQFVATSLAVRALMGKGGERISKLQADTETIVDIVREDDGDRDGDATIVVAGGREGVDAAAAEIEKVILENFVLSVTMDDNEFVGQLVGKKGESIKKFQARAAPLLARGVAAA